MFFYIKFRYIKYKVARKSRYKSGTFIACVHNVQLMMVIISLSNTLLLNLDISGKLTERDIQTLSNFGYRNCIICFHVQYYYIDQLYRLSLRMFFVISNNKKVRFKFQLFFKHRRIILLWRVINCSTMYTNLASLYHWTWGYIYIFLFP